MAERPCSTVARALGEPLLATASQVRAWLLLEQPGPWGREALVDSRLPPGVARELRRRGERAGVRVVLIRRPGRARHGPRTCFVAATTRHSRWLERRLLADLAELRSLDLDRVAAGERPGFGEAVTRPLYLVCTNGRHDRCCATFGRPLAAALAEGLGERVWECSHIGGDRFAGNLVCLPEGAYYGRLGPGAAARVAALHEQGRIELGHYRGRCLYPPAVQAAEHFLRAARGLDRLDDLVAEHRADGPGGVSAVRFADRDGRRHLVRLQATPADPPRLLTCTSDRPLRPPAYRLLAIEEPPG